MGELLAKTLGEESPCKFRKLKGFQQLFFRTHLAEDLDIQSVVWSWFGIHGSTFRMRSQDRKKGGKMREG